MKPESIVFAAAGVVFGVIVGYVMGAQDARTQTPAMPAQAGAPSATASQGVPPPRPLDEGRASTLEATAAQDPQNARVRVELGDLYFDAERPADAIRWYEAALTINPRDDNVSTDLGVSYYYTGDADRALKQFEHSLSVDPTHSKTLLNIGVVRAFGKQDLKGAVEVWEALLKVSPASEEGQAARKALENLKAAHPEIGGGAAAGGAPRGGA